MISDYFKAISNQLDKLAEISLQKANEEAIERAKQQEREEMMAECERLGIDMDALIDD